MNSYILLFLIVFPLVSSGISYAIGRKSKSIRDYFVILVCGLNLVVLVYLFMKVFMGEEFYCYVPFIVSRGLFLQLDGFRAIYGTITAFMWMMTSMLSHEYFAHYRNRNRYYFFLLLTFAGTTGVFLSGDLYTTFVFFEIMSLASYLMVIHDEKPEAMRAGDTYLFIAVLGGMVMLMGLFLMYNTIGTLRIDELHDAIHSYIEHGGNSTIIWVSSICMLFGFGAKAGMYPVHIWLPKAHPVAPAPASALLSGVLTKSGVFGVLIITSRIFLHDAVWGRFILYIGTITMFLGALLALFSIDLKRTLACSSMSQIGFILVACGMQGLLGHHNAYAVRGALLHMVNHSMFKLILFMCAGVVYMNCHKLNLNDIKGFGRNKWILNIAFLMGLLGIIGMPFWSGYVSKTLIHDAIVEYIEELHHEHHPYVIYQFIEWVFLISGGLTAAYMTKLYVSIFYEKNIDDEKQKKFDSLNKTYMKPLSTFAIVCAAILPPILGMTCFKSMDALATLGGKFMHGEYKALDYFSWKCIKGAVISLSIAAFVYLFIVRTFLMRKEHGKKIYINIWPESVDLENSIYRPLLGSLISFFIFLFSSLERLVDEIRIFISNLIAVLFSSLERLVDEIRIFISNLIAVLFMLLEVLVNCIIIGVTKFFIIIFKFSEKFIDYCINISIFIFSFLFRCLDYLIECILYTFRITVLKASTKINKKEDKVFTILSQENNNRKILKLITNSLAFSLVLFCIGICIVFIYVIYLHL